MRIVVLNERRLEREWMVRALVGAGDDVEGVADSHAALTAVGREPPQVVLACLGGSGGAEIVRALHAADASGQIYLVVVVEGTCADVPAILSAGAHDFMRRPILPVDVLLRVQGSVRALRWARSVGRPTSFDAPSGLDFASLRAWKALGDLVASDLAQVVNEPLTMTRGWPARFHPDAAGTAGTAVRDRVRGATISMSLVGEQIEVRLSVAADPGTRVLLAKGLLDDPGAGAEVLDDVLRELANTAGGAVKRAALADDVTLTTGIPVNDDPVRPAPGSGLQAWTATFAAGHGCLGLVGEIRRHVSRFVPASSLREGMILLHDIRGDGGAVLVTAGSRLTSSTASRLTRILDPQCMIEVATAA
jgi:DNA-binding response OmpR family regulator